MHNIETVPIWFICLYGFLKYLRPCEPFLTPYLSTKLNFTNEQLSQSIYPIWTYTYLVATIPVFLVSDFFRFRLLVVFESFSYVVTWVLLIFGSTLQHMQMMEVVFGRFTMLKLPECLLSSNFPNLGCGTALEVAFFAFMYKNVPGEQYKKATSCLKSCVQLAKFSSAIFGQLTFYWFTTHYEIINFTTLGT